MDTVLIEKLKQNFQTERREQVLKGKDLQKETMQRRRTMEMKAQLEAAKEEKRRQEALAERKARHIEATMRFQKGLKHFKFNKERISLEQVLKNIQPNQNNQQNSHHHRARLNSADDTTERSNYSNKDANSNYYSNSANKLNHLRKSSSFESLNSLLNTNYNSDLNINYTQNNNNYMKPVSSNKMIIEQMKLTNNNNNNNTNIPQHMNAYNPETLTENTNFKINRHHIQNIIYNDNKTNNNNNDVMSKENLKDFQNLVANELNFNKIIKINPKQHFYDTSNVLTVDDYRNGLYNKHDNKQEEDQVSTDSMETDSLINLNLDGADNQTYKLTNKIDNGENDTNDEILFLNNNIKKKEPISNHLNSNYNSHIDASNLWFSSHTTLTNNSNKPKVKTTNQQKFQQQQQQPVIKQPITVTHNIVNRNNSAGNIKENNNNNNNISNNKEIKSILKRSTSLENNLTIGNFATTTTSNQVKPASDNNIKNSGVKDSLDVANMRKIKNENEFNETNGKKSVRFATQLNDFNNNDINKTEVFSQQPIENKLSTQATLNLAQPTAEDQNRISSTNSIRRPVIKSKNPILNGYNNKNKSIKSEVISNNGDIVTTTTIITSPKIMMNNHYKVDDYTINSEKPPAHPNTTYNMMNSGGNSNTPNGGNSSYSIIGQKRREILQQRGKLNSGGSSSCSTTSGSGGSSGLLMNDRLLLNSPKQQQQQQNGVNIKIDVAPSPNTSNYSTPTILPLNRLTSLTSPSPISSPNQFFPIPISSSSQTSSSLTNNSSSNNNNSYNNHFSNSKLIEGNYREYQLSKQNNGSVPSTPTSNNTMRLNNNTVIDMNLYKKLDISNYLDQQHQLNQIYNREYYSNNNNNNNNSNKQQSEYNQVLSKIPLSPKNSLKQYNDTLIKSPNINNHEQIILRRPISEISNNTPNTMFTSKPPTPPNSFNATPTATFTQLMSPKIMQPQQQQQQQNSNLNDVNKTNIRFAYINSPLSSNQTNFTANTNSLENQTNKNFNQKNDQKNQNTIHLEIKYPLYSNHTAQNTQYINIAKPISRQTSFESDPNNQKSIPVSISVEEQNVKNSIMRLNERLNMLQNHQRYTSNGDYLNGTNYDNLNKNKTNGRPITTNITKLRR